MRKLFCQHCGLERQLTFIVKIVIITKYIIHVILHGKQLKQSGRCPMSKKLQTVLIALLVFVMLFSVSGCRRSSVIEEIIYDQKADEIDHENDTKLISKKKDAKNKDPNLATDKSNDSNNKSKIKHNASEKGNEKNDGETSDTKHDKDTSKDSKNDSDGTKTGDKGKKEGSDDDDTSEGGTDDPNGREYENEDGTTVNLPDEISNVVATGDAALIAQMLGGKDIIKGSSSNFLSNSLVQSVFADEGIGSVASLWDGDGDSNMSASNFNKLLKLKPDACIITNGQKSFSESQKKQLLSNNIPTIKIPKMESHESIMRAVNNVGEAIKDRTNVVNGGLNAVSEADRYTNYSNDLSNNVTKLSGNYTLFISDWVDSSYKVTQSGSLLYEDTNGAALAPYGSSYSLLDYYLEKIGVTNSGSKLTKDGDAVDGKYIATPLYLNVTEQTAGNKYTAYPVKGGSQNFFRTSTKIALGHSKFNKVLVSNERIKGKVEKSRQSGYLQVFDSIDNGAVAIDHGFIANGVPIESDIIDKYEVIVNPSGVGSWAKGSAESVLEPMWASYAFNGEESRAKTKIKEFYSVFYRHSLSDSELVNILDGE